MTCKEMENLLAGLVDGALSEEERHRVEAHLRTCETCRKALADLENADRLVKRMEEVAPPPWLKTRVMARVREEAQQRQGFLRKLFYPLYIKVPIQALATVLIAVVAWNVYKAGEPEFRQAAPPSAALQETPKAQAPTAPAPAAGTVKEDRPAVREKKAFAPPPPAVEDRMERKAETSREAPGTNAAMPAKPPEASGSAPVPHKDKGDMKMSDAAVRQGADRAMPAPAMEQKQKALKAPVGSVARESAKLESASPMPSTAVASRPNLEMTLRSADPAAAAVRAEAVLRELNARIAERQTRGGTVILTATITPENLDALREKLKSIGPLREGAALAPLPGAPLSIRLEIRPE